MREQLTPDENVDAFFVNNRAQFDRVRLSVIVTSDLNLAKEIVMQVEEDGEDFHALARQHSTEAATRYNGGHLGLVGRKNFPEDLAAKIFSCSADSLVGPVETAGACQLFLVEEVVRAELTAEVKETIKTLLFDQWSSQFLKEGYSVTSD